MKQGWKIKKLGEVTTSINGLWTGKKPPFITIAVIRNTNFTKDCKLDTSDIAYIDVELKQYARRKLQCGDIIIEKSGGSDKQPVGRPILFNIEEGEYSFSNFTSTLRVNDKTATIPEFIHRYLAHIYMRGDTAAMQSKTTGIRNLDFNLYKSINIPIPPLPEQEKIVAELDCLSGIIEKKKQQLKELDALAQSIFYTMFGDPITNEKGWDVKRLGDIGKVITGNTPSTKDEENYSSKDYCFVKPSDIGKDYVTNIEKTEFYISEKAFFQSRKLCIGSVLTTCIGIIGKVGVLKVDATCNQQINAILPNDNYISEYIAWAIYLIKGVIEDIANAPVVPIINKGEFSNIMIPIPPIELQQEFASKIEAIEKQKALIKQSITETEELFNSRMDYYFG